MVPLSSATLLFRMPGMGRGRYMAFRIYVSSLAADRLAVARDLLRARDGLTPTLIIGASRGAADDLARAVAATLPATFGLQRVSLTQLAARSRSRATASRSAAREET